MNLPISNGGIKVTLIETFDNRAIIRAPGIKLDFESLTDAKKHISDNGMEANISWAFGSSMARKLKEANGGNN